MTITVTHATPATLPDDPNYEIGSTKWNEAHIVTGDGPTGPQGPTGPTGDAVAWLTGAGAQAAARASLERAEALLEMMTAAEAARVWRMREELENEEEEEAMAILLLAS